MEQSAVNARLDKLESSVSGVLSAVAPLTSFLLSQQEQEGKCTIIKVARDEDLTQQIGKDIHFDLVDYEKVKCFRVTNMTLFYHFKEEFATEIGIPVQFLRFWLMGRRMNQSYRPLRLLTPFEESKTVSQDLRPITPPEKTKDDILLFFKLYDPLKEELRYVGRLFVKGFGKPSEILMKLNEMAGYGCEEEIILYEEIKFEPRVLYDPIDKELTFRESELEDGDIICFQKAIRLPDVPSYLRHLQKHRIDPRLRNQ